MLTPQYDGHMGHSPAAGRHRIQNHISKTQNTERGNQINEHDLSESRTGRNSARRSSSPSSSCWPSWRRRSSFRSSPTAATGSTLSPAAALFGAGVGTLVYLLFTKFRSPVFLGSSFAFLGSMAAAFAGGVSMTLGYVGPDSRRGVCRPCVCRDCGWSLRSPASGWLQTASCRSWSSGPTVSIIGLSLAGNAVSDLMSRAA